MTIETLLDICTRYADLGAAIQEQLKDVMDDTDTVCDQNPNAVRIFIGFLKDTQRQLDIYDDRELRDEITSILDVIAEEVN